MSRNDGYNPTAEQQQNMDNLSFDRKYLVNSVELLVENETETEVVRQKPIATEAKQDEIIVHLPLNEENRLKVSSVSIDYAHEQIHKGNHFFYSDCVELGSGGVQDYLITTTTKFSHLSFVVDGSAITAFDIYEASDKTGTTLQTIFNNNRPSATTSANTIHKGVSGGTTDGTKIWCHKSGSSTNQSKGSASSSQNSEIILKLNTKYIIRITSSTAGNLTNIKLNWYEK